MNCPHKKHVIKQQAALTCFLALIAALGCSNTSSVKLLHKDNFALKKLTATENFTLSAGEIVDLAQANGKIRENSTNLPIYSFLRRVTITKPTDVNGTINEQVKTYKAYTNNRDQTLIKVNGRNPTEKEIEQDRKRNLKRQRQYLERNGKKNSNRIISNNIEIYRDKFIPRLIGYESVNSRPAYIIQLVPNPEHRLKNTTSDRIMNQMQVKIWVDQEEFQVAKMEAKLVEPVKMFAGVIGSINSANILLEQKRLTPKIWTDYKLEADYDIRIIIAKSTGKITSHSSNFKLMPFENATKP